MTNPQTSAEYKGRTTQMQGCASAIGGTTFCGDEKKRATMIGHWKRGDSPATESSGKVEIAGKPSGCDITVPVSYYSKERIG
jgi:hypothetical protein